MPLTGTEATLTNPDPLAYLPHRPPFLFIDRVLSREAGVAATGEYAVPAGQGYFPPMLLVECMAQLGGIAAGQRPGEGGVLAAMRLVELPARVEPGSRFTVSSSVVRSFGQMVLVAGEVRQDGLVVASAALTLVLTGAGEGQQC